MVCNCAHGASAGGSDGYQQSCINTVVVEFGGELRCGGLEQHGLGRAHERVVRVSDGTDHALGSQLTQSASWQHHIRVSNPARAIEVDRYMRHQQVGIRNFVRQGTIARIARCKSSFPTDHQL